MASVVDANRGDDDDTVPPTPTLSTLPNDLKEMEPDIVIGSPNLMQVLETYCVGWLETIQVAISYVNSARLVPDNASVFELPLEEINFWKKRSLYLTPLSNHANQKNSDVQWTIRVLSLVSSTPGEKLREACASLRRLSVEATWNSKYLTILEKPFKALAIGPLRSVYTSIPGMVKTLKMVAASSRFYNSVERIEKLLERITLALCTHSVLETNPSVLIRHEMYALVCPKQNGENNNNRPTEDPFVTLTRVIETLEKWHLCIAPLKLNFVDKIDFGEEEGNENGDKMATNSNSSGNRKTSDSGSDIPSTKTRTLKMKKKNGNAWDELNTFRLFVHSEYIKERCEELRDIFQKIQFYKDDYDTSTLAVNTNGDGVEVIKKRREIIHSILQILNECTKKRVRPRIGVLPASVEYIFEPRNNSKWNHTKNEIIYFLRQLDEVSNSGNKPLTSLGSKYDDDVDEYLVNKLDKVDF